MHFQQGVNICGSSEHSCFQQLKTNGIMTFFLLTKVFRDKKYHYSVETEGIRATAWSFKIFVCLSQNINIYSKKKMHLV